MDDCLALAVWGFEASVASGEFSDTKWTRHDGGPQGRRAVVRGVSPAENRVFQQGDPPRNE
jgi:hypothetical protein